MGLSNQDATAVVTNNGLRTQYGLILPPGARVAAYVRSTGFQSGDDAFLAANLVPTLAQGLARVRPGLGDFVVVLPGHNENVVDGTTFSNALLAGTKIVGVGRGANAPTFTWTTGSAQWLVAVNDVLISGLRIFGAGPSAGGGALVALGISVTGSDFGFYNNDVEYVSGTTNMTSFMTISGAGSNRFDISGNYFHGQLTIATLPFLTISSTGVDGRVCDNEIVGPGSVNAQINVTGTPTRLKMLRNTMYNVSAASLACVAFAATASDGVVANNMFGVKNTAGTASAQGITFGAGCLVVSFQNFCADTAQQSGLLSPVANT